MPPDSQYRWIATPAPPAARYDDIWFLDPLVGWAINANGQILKTEDGGAHWRQQAHFPHAWPRCISMASARVGWVGGTVPRQQLIATTDGGQSWRSVTNLPEVHRGRFLADAPSAICGIWALPDEKHVFAAGSNDPNRRRRFLKSVDGGRNWLVQDMDERAALLVDVYFENELHGWLIGARSLFPTSTRADVTPEIWRTEDGGGTWTAVLRDQIDAPLGEWGWKIQVVDRDFIVVSCESFHTASILVSEDGGRRWRRQEIRDARGELINANIEGVGFLDRSTGWVGGWGDAMSRSGRTSMTTDGGKSWSDQTGLWPRIEPGQRAPLLTPAAAGQYINRFRCAGNPVTAVYASGNTIYKYTDRPLYEPSQQELTERSFLAIEGSLMVSEGGTVEIPIDVPAHVQRLTAHCYDRFAGWIGTLIDAADPTAGKRALTWALRTEDTSPLLPGQYVVRVSCDDRSESCFIFCDPGLHAPRARPVVPAPVAVGHAMRPTAAAAHEPRMELTLPYRIRREVRHDD